MENNEMNNISLDNNQKTSTNKGLIVIIVILVIALIAALVVPSLLDKNKDNKEGTNTEEKQKEKPDDEETPGEEDEEGKETTDDGTEETPTEPVEETKLTEEEVLSLLKFIPGTYSIVESNDKAAYNSNSINKDTINKQILLAESLCHTEKFKTVSATQNDVKNRFGQVDPYDYDIKGYYFVTKDEIANDLYDFYGIDSSQIKFTRVAGCARGFLYGNGGYTYFYNHGYGELLFKIEKYTETNDTLEVIVYTGEKESAGYYGYLYYPKSMKSVKTNCKENDEACHIKYFNDNCNKFPKYKHIFKKSDGKYKWYSSELLN